MALSWPVGNGTEPWEEQHSTSLRQICSPSTTVDRANCQLSTTPIIDKEKLDIVQQIPLYRTFGTGSLKGMPPVLGVVAVRLHEIILDTDQQPLRELNLEGTDSDH